MRAPSLFLMFCRLGVVVLLMLVVNLSALASTLLQMSFGEIAKGAELIFEGRVLAVEARQQPGEMIKTWVRFAVIDVVKGDFAEDEIELSFLGGRLGGRQLEVTDMTIPDIGETGFYFVETLLEAQVNPLLGWDQGRYLIEKQADGDSVVTTVDHEPVLILSVNDNAPSNVQPMNILETRRADGVVVQSYGTAGLLSEPMSAEDFKSSIRSVLARP